MNLTRTVAITLVCIVTVVLAVSFVGYVGERIVHNFTIARSAQ